MSVCVPNLWKHYYLPPNNCTCNLFILDSGMGRMMLGSMSSYLSSLQQHRKSQYTGNVIGGANEEPFLQKSCSYTQYNLLPPNKTEGELRVKLLQKTTINISVPAAVELSCSWWHIWWLRASQSVSKSNWRNYTTTVIETASLLSVFLSMAVCQGHLTKSRVTLLRYSPMENWKKWSPISI